jgi:RNA polymerase sigma-70 factor, ECF subfamily
MEATSLASPWISRTGAPTNCMENWVGQAKAGDQEAIRSLYERFVRPMLQFIYDMVGQRGLAEDLTQETFIRAFRNLASLREESKFSTWLFGIARNVVLESIRSRGPDRMRDDFEREVIQNIRDDKPLPEGALLSRELRGVIQDALESLDLDKRQVFILKVLQGFSYEEISGITGFSIPKLKTDLHRARAEMRQNIRPYLEVKNGL